MDEKEKISGSFSAGGYEVKAVMTQPTDSDAIAAILANRHPGKTLTEAWEEFVKKCQQEMQEKGNLAGGFNEQLPKNED